MRRQPGLRPEGADQGVGPDSGRQRQLFERGRLQHPLMQQGQRGAYRGTGFPRARPAARPGVLTQQAGQRGVQQAGGGQRVAMLGGQVGGPDQPGAARIVHHRVREERAARRPGQLRADLPDHTDRRVEHPVGPAFGDAGLPGVHHLRVEQGDRAAAGPQQAAAVPELLHPVLDQREGVALMRVPRVAVRHVPGPQQVDAGHGRVPPVTRHLPGGRAAAAVVTLGRPAGQFVTGGLHGISTALHPARPAVACGVACPRSPARGCLPAVACPVWPARARARNG